MFARKRILAIFASFFLLITVQGHGAEGDASFAVSPESAYSLIDYAIRDAHDSILLNIYMLTNRNVTQALADKAQKDNVKVTVLLEGETFGGEILAPVKRVLDDLYLRFDQQSQGRGKILVMSGQNGPRRFVFDHAKYMVIDGKKVFVSSENITGSAFGNKNLSGGSRGWQIYLENTEVAGKLSQIFQADSDSKNPDILPYQKVNFKVKDPGNDPLPPRKPRDITAFNMQGGRVKAADLCSSPKSLECILSFIREAKEDLAVEHLSLPKAWVGRNGAASKPNPIVEELISAARRGVRVRVLLNNDGVFGQEVSAVSEEDKNISTVAYLRSKASKEKIPLEAAIFNNDALEVAYVHNKGMVADGSKVFLGSINGTENAVMNNREVAVSLSSKDAARYFGEVFQLDWEMSNKK